MTPASVFTTNIAPTSETTIVTGGRGLIGSAIVSAIEHSGRTLCIGRSAHNDIQRDLASQALDFSPAAGGNWVHAAGVTDEECVTSATAALTRAALATPAMIDAAVAAGVEKFVYVSSAHVYGPLEGTFDETSPVNPVSLYAQCHFLAEQAFRLCASKHQKPVLILRPCAVYGMPWSLDAFKRWSLIPYEFPRNAVQQQKIQIRSSGLQSRNFVSTSWIAELVRQFLQANQQRGAQILNPIGADDITVRDFALRCKDAYLRATDKQCDVQWLEAHATPPAFVYSSRSAHAICTASKLDDYLYEILTRLEQHVD